MSTQKPQQTKADRKRLAERFWNPERDALLRQYRERDGLSIADCRSQLLDQFGGSLAYCTIQKRCQRLKLVRSEKYIPKPRESWWTPEREDELAQAHQDGIYLRKIADKLGKDVGAIASKCKRMGLRRKPDPLPAIPGSRAAPVAIETPPAYPQPSNILTFDRQSPQLWELGASACRWPIGDPLEAGFHFCGQSRKSFGVPYCEHHALIAYNPPKRRAA